MFKSACYGLLGILWMGSIALASAHHYFFGLTDITANHTSHHLEIIHQFTAHDVENLIAVQQNIRFGPEHPHYEQMIRQYFEKNFEIQFNNEKIPLSWVGLEVSHGQLFVYQEALSQQFLLGLVVKNRLLIDNYPKQVNTVNYLDGELSGSLSFSESEQVAVIKIKN